MTDLGTEWTSPAGSPGSWFGKTHHGATEVCGVLSQCPERAGQPTDARALYRRVIHNVLRPRNQIGHGYYDFEGPFAALVRVGVLEVVSERRPSPGEVSPSCVGPGTWSVPKGSPITWTVQLTELGERVRDYWRFRNPYTGEARPGAVAAAQQAQLDELDLLEKGRS